MRVGSPVWGLASSVGSDGPGPLLILDGPAHHSLRGLFVLTSGAMVIDISPVRGEP